jgi:hypothetical protein
LSSGILMAGIKISKSSFDVGSGRFVSYDIKGIDEASVHTPFLYAIATWMDQDSS